MRSPFPALALAGALASSAPAAWCQADVDLTELTLKDLLKLPVISTPKFAANAADVPSSVSMISAEDIRVFGWRTLADVLRSLQGINVTDDHIYASASVRGVSADFRSRMLVLIDGIQINENLYSSAVIDNAFPLDLDLVHHIEVVRGPSASVYGGDSMFGVINVITRTGRSLNAGEVAASTGSGRANQLRGTWGHYFGDNGVDLLLSATGFDADGRGVAFPEMAAVGLNPVAEHVGKENGEKFFARLTGTDWRATLIHSRRNRVAPTGIYGTVFNDPASAEEDAYTLAELGNDHPLDGNTSLHSRVFAGRYMFTGNYPYDYAPPYEVNRDYAEGRWWGLEARLLSTAWQGHRWNAGFEYQNNYRQAQLNEDPGYGCFGVGAAPCLDDRRSSHRLGIYAQDEIALLPTTHLTLGLRYDHTSEQQNHWSPRLGLVHHTEQSGIFKLLYASAFRNPNVYERYYNTSTWVYGNPDLKSEQMRSIEGSWEKQFDPATRLTVTGYLFRMENLIAMDGAGLAQNLEPLDGRGGEFEFERRWDNKASFRAGYSFQLPRSSSGRPDNAPLHLAKINLGLPLWAAGWMAGIEGQAMSRRLSASGATQVGGHLLANLNITYQPGRKDWDLALGIYNLFDRTYADPVGMDTTLPVFRDRIIQNGRNFRLKVTVRF